MWQARVRFSCSSSAARVVDLPEPVAPVTSTSPCGSSTRLASEGGSCSSARLGISVRSGRRAAAIPPWCRNRFARTRTGSLPWLKAKSTLPAPSSWAARAAGRKAANDARRSAASLALPTSTSWSSIRSSGRDPVDSSRSDAPRAIA